jgi:hypothetical protein
MFQTAIAEPAVKVPVEELIPLSVLQLDLPVPGDGWNVFLAGRGIEVLTDDLGREAVARSDARRLLTEQREYEARRAEFIAAADRQAEEFDRVRRSQLFRGIPADLIPPGALPAEAMVAAAHDARPRRESVLETALSNSGEITFHPYSAEDDE